MKALTLRQPWASLVANGHKKFETRTWRTSHRGPLAITAAGSMSATEESVMMLNPAIRRRLVTEDGVPSGAALPKGCVVAVGWLVDVKAARDVGSNLFAMGKEVGASRHGEQWHDAWSPQDEVKFGDYGDGRWAWAFDSVVSVPAIQVRGKLGLWDLPKDVEMLLLGSLIAKRPVLTPPLRQWVEELRVHVA